MDGGASKLQHERGAPTGAPGDAAQGGVSNGAAARDEREDAYGDVLHKLRRSFETGRTRDVAFRKAQLESLRRGIDELSDELVDATIRDLGRPVKEARIYGIVGPKGDIDYALQNMDSWVKPVTRDHPSANLGPGTSQVYYEPRGVVLCIAPWNYPIKLSLSKVITAISAGCCFVLKPSEVAPSSALVLEKLVTKYLDGDCYAVIQGAVAETTALLQLRWDMIFYTGNGAVGRIVAAAAAKHLTPTLLELGGKSPVVIDKNCNLEIAAKRILWGKCVNSGQTCVSPDYVLVHKQVKQAFLTALTNTLMGFYGPPGQVEKSASYARIVNVRHFDRLASLMQNHGGKVLYGGMELANRENKFIPPTVIIEPRVDSSLMTEEIFGPLLPVLEVDDLSEAIRFIKAREHPLALYFFSEDATAQEMIVQRTTSGGICINDVIMHLRNHDLPFGGSGASGMGSYRGIFGFRALSHEKAVMRLVTSVDDSTRYPPYTQ